MMNVNELPVLLFNSGASTSARLHARECGMLSTANRRVVRVDFRDQADMQANLEDLAERGFKVVRCKCLKG